ncbi:TetR/AcrR family transcriptional regulator [Streptomyces sp. NPDC005438]|uniref:TetR/AcrR family transcriptional regulator n=1 Tax=Streptomyces sp. NPDC005438 TaxID=3156880 RepID=UPI0033BCE0E7
MLDAAVAGFARHGYRAASMDDIADAAGVSKPLVYLYLKSKDDLFTACVRREATALVRAVRTATEEPAHSADERLWRGLRGFFDHTAAHPDSWTLLHQRAVTEGSAFARYVADTRAELADLVTGLLVEAAKEAGHHDRIGPRDVAGLAHALVGAAESLADWVNSPTAHTGSGKPPTAQEAAATLMNFCWPGLEKLMRGDRWTPPRGSTEVG